MGVHVAQPNETGVLRPFPRDAHGARRGRRHGLRPRWYAGLALMILVLAAALGGAFLAYRAVVDEYGKAARELSRTVSLSSELRGNIAAHEAQAHLLWNGARIDHAAYRSQEAEILREFAQGLRNPASPGERALLVRAERTWRSVLVRRGLFGPSAKPLSGVTLAMQQRFGSDSDEVAGMLATLSDRAVAQGSSAISAVDRQRTAIFALVLALFALVLGVALYLARRVTADVLQPVESLQRAAVRLGDGDLRYRVEVSDAHPQEFSDLARAFNAMATALDENHRGLTHQANHDSLTGLPNRAAFEHELAGCFTEALSMTPGVGVLFVDVDDFKQVNDTLGHAAGDELLVGVARCLLDCTRPGDLVGRLAGDEFAILIRDPGPGSRTAIGVAERVFAVLAAPMAVVRAGLRAADGTATDMRVEASIGIAVRGPGTESASQLLAEADFAMYMAKSAGKGRYQVFDAGTHDDALARAALRSDLARAVEEHQLRVEYQPVVDLQSGVVVGVEALVRWSHPSLGMLPPSDFIGLAEETGEIVGIGAWVLRSAARQVTAWRRNGASDPRLWVSVNLSPRQLETGASVDELRAILAAPDVDPAAVVLEITESQLAGSGEEQLEHLRTLKRGGVRVALDDFGVGFSCLDRLQALPVDVLKIDRSFVSGAAAGLRSEAVVGTVIDLAGKLGLSVIAEGIEEPEQLEQLRELACPQGQGFVIARPAAAEAIAMMLSPDAARPRASSRGQSDAEAA